MQRLLQLARILADPGQPPDLLQAVELAWLARHLPSTPRVEEEDDREEDEVEGSADGGATAKTGAQTRGDDGSDEGSTGEDEASKEQDEEDDPGLVALGAGQGADVAVRVHTAVPPPALQEATYRAALRDLRLLGPDPSRQELDLDATLRHAQPDLLCPVLVPRQRKRVELHLVVDAARSMDVWRGQIRAFERVLRGVGAFRSLIVWTLDGDAGTLHRGAPRVGAPEARPHRLRGGRDRLVLVVSDLVGDGWVDGASWRVLEPALRRHPVAVVQVLPERSWAGTSLRRSSAGHLQVRPGAVPRMRVPGDEHLPAVRDLRWTPRVRWAASRDVSRVAVLPLRPDGALALSRWLRGNDAIEAFELPIPRRRDPVALDAPARVSAFLSGASPQATELARLLLAAPVIDLSVLRRLQEFGGLGRDPMPIAEVLTGGLLQVVGARGPDPERTQYRFLPGVARALLPHANRARLFQAAAVLFGDLDDSGRWRERLMQPASHRGRGVEESAGGSGDFAEVMQRLGGVFAAVVRRVDEVEGDGEGDGDVEGEGGVEPGGGDVDWDVARPLIPVVEGSYADPEPPWGVLGTEDVRALLQPWLEEVGAVLVDGEVVGTAVSVGAVLTSRWAARRIREAGGRATVRWAGGLEAEVRGVVLEHPLWDVAVIEAPEVSIEAAFWIPSVARGVSQGQEGVAIGLEALGGASGPGRSFYLAPGTIAVEGDDLIVHDGARGGMEGGAALVDLETGAWIGLVLGGGTTLPAWQLARDPRLWDAGVAFGGERPEVGDPEVEAAWTEVEGVAVEGERPAGEEEAEEAGFEWIEGEEGRDPELQLARWLMRAFGSPHELMAFVLQSPSLGELRKQVDWDGSLAEVAYDLAYVGHRLRLWGEVVFGELVAERPREEDEIRSIARQFGVWTLLPASLIGELARFVSADFYVEKDGVERIADAARIRGVDSVTQLLTAANLRDPVPVEVGRMRALLTQLAVEVGMEPVASDATPLGRAFGELEGWDGGVGAGRTVPLPTTLRSLERLIARSMSLEQLQTLVRREFPSVGRAILWEQASVVVVRDLVEALWRRHEVPEFCAAVREIAPSLAGEILVVERALRADSTAEVPRLPFATVLDATGEPCGTAAVLGSWFLLARVLELNRTPAFVVIGEERVALAVRSGGLCTFEQREELQASAADPRPAAHSTGERVRVVGPRGEATSTIVSERAYTVVRWDGRTEGVVIADDFEEGSVVVDHDGRLIGFARDQVGGVGTVVEVVDLAEGLAGIGLPPQILEWVYGGDVRAIYDGPWFDLHATGPTFELIALGGRWAQAALAYVGQWPNEGHIGLFADLKGTRGMASAAMDVAMTLISSAAALHPSALGRLQAALGEFGLGRDEDSQEALARLRALFALLSDFSADEAAGYVAFRDALRRSDPLPGGMEAIGAIPAGLVARLIEEPLAYWRSYVLYRGVGQRPTHWERVVAVAITQSRDVDELRLGCRRAALDELDLPERHRIRRILEDRRQALLGRGESLEGSPEATLLERMAVPWVWVDVPFDADREKLADAFPGVRVDVAMRETATDRIPDIDVLVVGNLRLQGVRSPTSLPAALDAEDVRVVVLADGDEIADDIRARADLVLDRGTVLDAIHAGLDLIRRDREPEAG